MSLLSRSHLATLLGGLGVVAGAVLGCATAAACTTSECVPSTAQVLGEPGGAEPAGPTLRLGLGGSVRSREIGDPAVAGLTVTEVRADPVLGWQDRRWDLSLHVPVAHRRVARTDGGRTAATALQDASLGAALRLALGQTAWGLRMGGDVVLPTGTVARDARGRLDDDGQPAVGAWGFRTTATLAWSGTPAWVRLDTSLSWQGTGRTGIRPGVGGGAAAASQFRLGTLGSIGTFWVGAATELRGDQPRDVHGEPDPDSGGWLLSAGPTVALARDGGIRAEAGVMLPAYSALRGRQTEGVAGVLRVVWTLPTASPPPPAPPSTVSALGI